MTMLPMIDLNLNLQGKTYLRVNGTSGSDNPRRGKNRAYQTIQAAIDDAVAGSVILVSPGAYAETVTISRTAAHANLTIIGMGGKQAAYIKPTVEDANGLLNYADGLTLYNLGVFGEDTTSAVAFTNFGSNVLARDCVFGEGATQIQTGPGTAAQITAGTHGTGDDVTFHGCTVKDGTTGAILTSTDHGVMKRPRFIDCIFSALSAAALEEAGGTASTRFQALLVKDCAFLPALDGTAATKYVSLNDDNANTGMVTGCRFLTALNSGLNLVSTKVIWAGNFHPAGLSTTQPS